MNTYCLAIVGSTGIGKTALSLSIAEYLYKEGYKSAIINMDSRQVYRDIPLLSAQPTKEEQVYFPHHYYGYLDITDTIVVEEYIQNITNCCNTLWKNNIIPILVGGTGMYFHVLFHGITHIPPIDNTIRIIQRNKVYANKSLAYQELCEYDAIFAKTITEGDSQRIARGLEVYHSTGIPLSQWYNEKKQKFLSQHMSITIEKPIPLLNEHLLQRIITMYTNGAIEEVANILKNVTTHTVQAFSCIGFYEIMHYLQGKLSQEECIQQWFTYTRQYAKRQRTWFRNKHTIHHSIEYTLPKTDIIAIVKKYIQALQENTN